jgi:hypothetical protein
MSRPASSSPGPTTRPVILGALLLVVMGALAATRWGSAPVPEADGAGCPAVSPEMRIAGVSFVAPRRAVAGPVMEPVRRVDAGWVALLPYGFVAPGGSELRFDHERQWWGEGVLGVRRQIEMARKSGLKVAVKPHVWIRGAGWTGDFLPTDREDRLRWEESYRDYVLTFARVAAEGGAELFVVGTELDRFARERPGYWRDLIRDVREVYPGKLTYAANWDAFHLIPFWDAVDYIGVDAYFPLSSSPTPTVDELVAAWQPWVDRVEEVSRRFPRPVLFAEYGYRSIDGAAGRQWELPPERRRDLAVNLQAQERAYEALFRVWWERPGFAGGFLWKWFLEEDAREGALQADYTPQGKPVEGLIRHWYGGELRAGS